MTPCTSSTVDRLTLAWRRVLGLPTIGADENFFDLGGDAASAAELFAQIAADFNRQLPPATICQAPTIASLSALLEESAQPVFPSVVLLRSGKGYPPIFITHGIGDTVLNLVALARAIESPHPIYGMQAPGIDGASESLASIEELARFHLEGIKKVQRQGPYLLVGYSLGGLVALEIAQRLVAPGDQVALLSMIETYPHRRHLRLGQHARLLSRRVEYHAFKAGQLPLRQAARYLFWSARGWVLARKPARGVVDDSPVGEAVTTASLLSRDNAYLAWENYRPRFYPGTIKFVKAAVPTHFPRDPAAVWSHLTASLDVETAPGDHFEVITTYAANVAAALTRYLKKVTCEGWPGPRDI